MTKKKITHRAAAKVEVEIIAPLGCGIKDNDYSYGDIIKLTRNQADGLLALKLAKEIT